MNKDSLPFLNLAMALLTLKSYAVEQGFSSVCPQVRENTNGYPFITFIDPKLPEKENAVNIYFSKSASKEVALGTPVKDIASKLYVTDVLNADGEPRTKLTFNKGEYIALEDLF
jgi:hypothetical protein